MAENLPTINTPAMLVMMVVLMAIVGVWVGIVIRFALQLPVLPKFSPRLVPWGPGSVILAIVVWLGLQIMAAAVYSSAVRSRPNAVEAKKLDPVPGDTKPKPTEPQKTDLTSREMTPGEMMGISAVSNIAILILVPTTLVLLVGARPRDFGFVRDGVGEKFAWGVMSYALLAPVVMGVNLAALTIWDRTKHPVEEAMNLDKSPGMLGMLVLSAVVLAPLGEELIFRGVVLGWLTRVAIGRKKEFELDQPDIEGVPPVEDATFSEQTPLEHPVEVSEPRIQPEFGQDAPIVDDSANPYRAPEQSAVATPSKTRNFRQFFVNMFASAVFTALHLPAVLGVGHSIPLSKLPIPIAIFVVSMGLLTWFQRSGIGVRLLLVNVLISYIFASMHAFAWPSPIPLFVLSLGLGMLYQRTGSVIPSIALHMTFNGVSTLLMILLLGGNAPKDIPKSVPPAKAVKVEPIVGSIWPILHQEDCKVLLDGP